MGVPGSCYVSAKVTMRELTVEDRGAALHIINGTMSFSAHIWFEASCGSELRSHRKQPEHTSDYGARPSVSGELRAASVKMAHTR